MASQCSPVGRASHEIRRSRKPNLSTHQGAASVARPQGTHRHSHRCAAAATCCTPECYRDKTPGRKHGRSRRNAGRQARGQRRCARSSRAQAHSLATAPGSVRRGSRSGLAGSAESRSSSGREHLARTQPSPQASSAPQLLHSPAFQCKSFRGHADSTASSVSRSPRLRATPGGRWSRRNALVPASTSDPPSGVRSDFPGGPFADGLEDFRCDVTYRAFLPT